MNVKKLIGIIVLIICIGIIVYKRFGEGYQIEKVVDGNTIVLNTGTTIRLIGVSNTKESKNELETLKNEGWKFDLMPDSHANFDAEVVTEDMTVYAYLLLRDNSEYECVNATLLKRGLAELLEIESLTDSIKTFRKYALEGIGKAIPTPIKPEPINYVEDEIILPNPPSISDSILIKRKDYQIFTSDRQHNLCILDSACDYDCAYTRKFASELAARSAGQFNIGQVCETFKYCYNKWRYVNDPNGREYVANASETIYNSLIGDCDDFAVLLGSCMLAIGGNVCINLASNNFSGHAFTEVDVAPLGNEDNIKAHIINKFPQYANNIDALNIRKDGKHAWLNLDWFSSYPGGRYYDYSRIERYSCVNGNWKVVK